MNKTIVCISFLLLGMTVLAGCGPAVTPVGPGPAGDTPLPAPTAAPAASSVPAPTTAPVPAGAPTPTDTPDDSLLLTSTPQADWQAQAPDLLALLPAGSGAKPLSAAFNKDAPVVSTGAALQQELAAADNTTLLVKNESNYTVCYLYLSPTTSDVWGDDWLGEEEVLDPGRSRRFTLAADTYDLLARDCDRQVIEEVWEAELSGQMIWTITGGEEEGEEAEPTPRPAATPATAPVTLDQFLCCGRTAGETRIWGISYPRGWEVTLVPDNPDYFLAAMFADPRSSMRILIAPSAWTPMGTAMDTGDVDQYLDASAAARARQYPGFREFYRQPLSGLPARVWAGTWEEGGLQYWESYTVMVTAMPYVEGMPRGVLMLLGLSAESSEWAQACDIYEHMLGSIQVEVISSGPAYEPPQPGPADNPVEQSTEEAGEAASSFWELVFCPGKCDWEYIDINNQPAGTIWDCSDGCRGYLSKVPCTEEWCR